MSSSSPSGCISNLERAPPLGKWWEQVAGWGLHIWLTRPGIIRGVFGSLKVGSSGQGKGMGILGAKGIPSLPLENKSKKKIHRRFSAGFFFFLFVHLSVLVFFFHHFLLCFLKENTVKTLE
jgi:hypothetical protein